MIDLLITPHCVARMHTDADTKVTPHSFGPGIIQITPGDHWPDAYLTVEELQELAQVAAQRLHEAVDTGFDNGYAQNEAGPVFIEIDRAHLFSSPHLRAAFENFVTPVS